VLRDVRFVAAWAGLRSTTAGGRPLLGRFPGNQRTLVATGHGSRGIVAGALSGRVMEDLLTTGHSEVSSPLWPGARGPSGLAQPSA